MEAAGRRRCRPAAAAAPGPRRRLDQTTSTRAVATRCPTSMTGRRRPPSATTKRGDRAVRTGLEPGPQSYRSAGTGGATLGVAPAPTSRHHGYRWASGRLTIRGCRPASSHALVSPVPSCMVTAMRPAAAACSSTGISASPGRIGATAGSACGAREQPARLRLRLPGQRQRRLLRGLIPATRCRASADRWVSAGAAPAGDTRRYVHRLGSPRLTIGGTCA